MLADLFCASDLVRSSFTSTTHIVNPILALLLDQIRASLELLGQRHLASLLSRVSKVIRQDHLVDINASDSPLDTLVQDLRDELVGSVKYDLYSVVDFFLDGFETVLFVLAGRTVDWGGLRRGKAYRS